jgi:hypothetical protein
MVPAAVLLLCHVPPPLVLLRDVEKPWHTEGVPPIATGTGLTDICAPVVAALREVKLQVILAL